MPPRRQPSIPVPSRLEYTGQQMRWIRSNNPHLSWLQGPGPTDLWVWKADDRPRTIELTFYGRTVHLVGDELRTGICKETASSAYAAEMGLVELDARPHPPTLEAAAAILSSLPESVATPDCAELLSYVRGALAEGGPKL